MVGRAAIVPLPDTLKPALAAPIAAVSQQAAAFLRASSTALSARERPPPLEPFEAALESYNADVEAGTFPGDQESYHLPADTRSALEHISERKRALRK